MKKTTPDWITAPTLAILFLLAGSTMALGQEGDQEGEAEAEEIFELSPFFVISSEDMGYVATNTLSGTRLNTRLSDIGASVSVFTEEFLNDTGLNDIQEITLYSVGSLNNIQDINSGPNINNFLGVANSMRRVRIRGLRGTKGLDYFQAYTPDDAYRTERYDESRGPNGILFGISEAGGVINTTPLRASPYKDSGRFRYSLGSYQRDRSEFRVNKVIIKDVLGVTVAGLYQDNGGWRAYQSDERKRLYGAINWQPTSRLTIQAWGESGNTRGSKMKLFNAGDRFLPWYINRNKFGLDAVTFVSGRGSTTLQPGNRDGDTPSNNPSSLEAVLGVDNNNVGRNAPGGNTGRRYVFVQNDGSFFNSASTWESESFEDPNVASRDTIFAATTLADIAAAGRQGGGNEYTDTGIILNHPGYEFDYGQGQIGFEYPTYLNAGGPDMYRAEDFQNFAILLDYRITDNLFVNFAYNHQENDLSAQWDDSWRPAIRGDPNLSLRNDEVAKDMGLDPDIPNPWVGRLYYESLWRYQVHFIEYDETRVALSYDLDFNDIDRGWMGRHRLAAGYSFRKLSDKLVGMRHAFLGNPYDFANADDFDDNRNRIFVRNYITEGDFSTYVQASPMVPGGQTMEVVTEDGETRTIGWVNADPGTGNAQSNIEVKSKIFAMQNFLWNDRLIFTSGWREDEADNIALGHVRDPIQGFVITDDPDAPGYRVDPTIIARTKTAGFVFKVTKNFSLLANWASSIGLPEFRNVVFPDAGLADPVQGEGYDVGIGFNLMNNRFSGRLVYFEGEAINRTSSGGGVRVISDPMWQSMRAMDELRDEFPDIIRNPDTGQPYSDSDWEAEYNALNGASGDGVTSTPTGRVNAFLQNEFTKGWEFTITANITDNWRLSLNASFTDRILLQHGHKFAVAAGFQQDEDGRFIQAVEVVGDTAISVDLDGVLAPGSIHQRILEIAQAAEGVIHVFDDDDDVILENVFKTLDPTLDTLTIDGDGNWFGPGALIINTDSGDTFEEDDDFNYDETVGYRIWESQDELQQRQDSRHKRWGLNPYKFNVFTAYDFGDGKLDGFTIGGGYRYLGGTIIGEGQNGQELTGPSQSYFDLMLKYTMRLKNRHRIVYQLNIYNLFNRKDPLPVRYVTIGDETLPFSRVKLVDPRSARLTITFSY